MEKSIQEYREEQERDGDVISKQHNENSSYNVDRSITSRVARQGKKDYTEKCESTDQIQNSWIQRIPSENFDNSDFIDNLERKLKKRKGDYLTKENFKQSKKEEFLRKVGSPGGQELQHSPYGSGNEFSSSPPPPSPSDRDLGNPTPLEPLFDEDSHLAAVGSPLPYPSGSYSEENKPIESDSDDEEISEISTISVDYEGMKGLFVQVNTFRDLLNCVLEYWEMNELTSPKDWILTSERGAMWPLDQRIRIYSPELVYLKRKPWR